jgi:hypothetical protein
MMMKSINTTCTGLPAADRYFRSCSTAVVPSSAVRRVALAKTPSLSLSISFETTLQFKEAESS